MRGNMERWEENHESYKYCHRCLVQVNTLSVEVLIDLCSWV